MYHPFNSASVVASAVDLLSTLLRARVLRKVLSTADILRDATKVLARVDLSERREG